MINLGRVIAGVKVDSVIFVLGTIIGFVFVPLVLIFLDFEKYGLYVSLMGVVSVLTLVDPGMGLYATKKLAAIDCRVRSTSLMHSLQLFQYGMALLFILVGVVSLVCLDSIVPIGKDLFGARLFFFLLWLNFIIQAVFSLFRAILRARGDLIYLNSILFFNQVLSYVFGLIFLWFGLGIEGLGWGVIISGAFTTFILAMRAFKYVDITFLSISRLNDSRDDLLGGWRYIRRFQILKLSHATKTSLFTVLVANLCGPIAAGMYAVSNKMPQIFPAFFSKVILNFMPLFSRFYESGDMIGFLSEFKRVFRVGVRVGCFVIVMLYIMNEKFISAWVGADKFVGQEVFVLMLANIAVVLLGVLVNVVVQVSGSFKRAPMISVVETIVFVSSVYFLSKFYGASLELIVVSLLLCSIVSLVYALKVASEVMDIHIVKLMGDAVFDCAVLCAALFIINYLFSSFGMNLISTIVLQSGVSFFCFLIWLRYLKKSLFFSC